MYSVKPNTYKPVLEKQKAHRQGRWANLMFSQRNNPYCDLLKIHCKYTKKIRHTKYFLIILPYICENNIIKNIITL